MATTQAPLIGTVNGINTSFSLGVPVSSVLIIFADSVPVYNGIGPGYFQVTNFATGAIMLGSAPVDPSFQPIAIYNDTTPATPPGNTASISGGGVIGMDIYYPIGTTASFLLGFGSTDVNGVFTPYDLTSAVVHWSVKAAAQANYPVVVAHSSPSSGITIPAPTSGVASLVVSPSDFVGDYPGAYVYSAQATLQSGQVVAGAMGRFFLQGTSI